MKNEFAKSKKHFNFFIDDPEDGDVLTINVIDQTSLKEIGKYCHTLTDLLIRKRMENELQAFPMMGSQKSEIIMALKLNIFKD